MASVVVTPVGPLVASGPPRSSAAASSPVAQELATFAASPLAAVRDTEPGLEVPGAVEVGPAPNTPVLILVSFPLQHTARLASFLTALTNPTSDQYHRYLTAAQFDATYGGNATNYAAAEAYFASFDVGQLRTAADNLTLTFEATADQVAAIFHTALATFRTAAGEFFAPLQAPRLPRALAATLLGVEGLSDYSALLVHTDSSAAVGERLGGGEPVPVRESAGYIPPAEVDGVQYEYAPDFQSAYDELSLFTDSGYPTNAVVATILWSGSNNEDQPVGPFNPSDIYAFFNETLPAGEPHASVTGVPLDGAPSPGPSAGTDVTGANFENTLDLEMVGSTAPGASIFNVYGPQPSFTDLDSAFSYILNPTSTPGLSNVTVISNSWGGQDTNDSTWYQDLQEAQARGISVLASSGDAADNPASSKWTGSEAEFPSSMAYDTFGVTAVGGTTVTMSSDLRVTNQVVWNITASDVADGGPAGSSGGISTVFSEPSWQANTSANATIGGAGRGTPDIGAVANNTLITITLDGYQYAATNATNGGPFEAAWGTSIAAPLEAGIVAEMDHVLQAHDNPLLGFLDPELYTLANEEYAPLPVTPTYGYDATGAYNSSLPTLPLLDVVSGSNLVYSARVGYDLVTGWGSIDAYNYTMYFLSVSSQGVYGRLSGVQDVLALSALNVTSYYDHAVYPVYNASIQQNFWVANSLGAPVYWVQNVVYINNTPSGWLMNYTGWVIYPPWGLYPSESVYHYNFPAGQIVTLPATFDVESVLETPAGFNTQYIAFSVNGQTIDVAAPGGSFIIGSLWYNYSWAGSEYENGPFPDNPVPGGLSPQFGLVGGPSLTVGEFEAPTAGTLAASIQPAGTSAFVPAKTKTFGQDIDQTGELAANLHWTPTSPGNWTLGTSPGSTTQGILAYQPAFFNVTFLETGLPAGTTWSVTLNGTTQSTVNDSLTFAEKDGNYSYLIGDVPGWHQSTVAYSGSLEVNGSDLTLPILEFFAENYSVSFEETGMPVAAGGGVDFDSMGVTPFGPGGTLTFSELANGTYNYTVANASGYSLVSTTPGSPLTLDGENLSVTVTFEASYNVTFSESGLPVGSTWSVTVNGGTMNTTSPTLTFSEGNGTFPYSIEDIAGWHQTTLPYSGSVEVIGMDVAEPTLEFSPMNYSVTFVETGMPVSAGGGVAFNGGSVQPFNLGGVLAYTGLTNGTYPYFIANGSGYALLSAGPPSPLVVEGQDLSVTVVFHALYAVTFTESGVPLASTWAVTLNGNASGPLPGSQSMTTFFVGNGSFAYAWSDTPGVHITTGTYFGNVLVVGANPSTVSVTFTPMLYEVTFSESGIPASLTWSVELNGNSSGPVSGSTTSTSLWIGNGTFAYAWSDTPGYHITSGTYVGTVQVLGSTPPTILVVFTPVTYTVRFVESGMPTVAGGGVNFNDTGTTPFALGGTALYSGLSNGTYPFVVSAGPGFTLVRASAASPVSVDGASVTITLTFVALFSVTFSERGMPTAAGGGVGFNGASPVAFSTGGTLTVQALLNGSYPYTVTAGTGYVLLSSSPSSPLTLSGTNLSVAIVFGARYSVTFTETGMPPSAGGGVAFNGSATAPFVAGGTLSLQALNGTYPFTVSGGPGYIVLSSLPNGTVDVQGSAATIQITFEAVYSVTFHEQGIPNGTKWTIVVTLSAPSELSAYSEGGGTTWSANSTVPTVTLALPNGTFSYSISAPGYSTATGTFNVTGQGQSVPASVSASASGGFAWWEWAVIIAAVAAGAIAAVLVINRRRKAGAPGVAPSAGAPSAEPPMPAGAAPSTAEPSTAAGIGATVAPPTAPAETGAAVGAPASPPMTPPPFPQTPYYPPAPAYNPAVLLVPCTRCGRPAVLVSEYGRYYCLTCRKYN